MIASPFSQAVQWPAIIVEPGQESLFEEFILSDLGTRAKFIGCYETLPDYDDYGCPVPETGGRVDCYFGVHEEDIGKFAVPRFQFGMRWVDDVLDNERAHSKRTIYVKEVHDLSSWSKEDEYLQDGSETGCVGD